MSSPNLLLCLFLSALLASALTALSTWNGAPLGGGHLETPWGRSSSPHGFGGGGWGLRGARTVDCGAAPRPHPARPAHRSGREPSAFPPPPRGMHNA